jgi:hypothetical protein
VQIRATPGEQDDWETRYTFFQMGARE